MWVVGGGWWWLEDGLKISGKKSSRSCIIMWAVTPPEHIHPYMLMQHIKAYRDYGDFAQTHSLVKLILIRILNTPPSPLSAFPNPQVIESVYCSHLRSVALVIMESKLKYTFCAKLCEKNCEGILLMLRDLLHGKKTTLNILGTTAVISVTLPSRLYCTWNKPSSFFEVVGATEQSGSRLANGPCYCVRDVPVQSNC